MESIADTLERWAESRCTTVDRKQEAHPEPPGAERITDDAARAPHHGQAR